MYNGDSFGKAVEERRCQQYKVATHNDEIRSAVGKRAERVLHSITPAPRCLLNRILHLELWEGIPDYLRITESSVYTTADGWLQAWMTAVMYLLYSCCALRADHHGDVRVLRSLHRPQDVAKNRQLCHWMKHLTTLKTP